MLLRFILTVILLITNIIWIWLHITAAYVYTVKFSLYFIKLHTFLTLALDWGEWSVSHPGCFYPQQKTLQYPLDRRLSGSQGWSGGNNKEKNPCPCQKSSLGYPVHCLVTILTEIPWLLTYFYTLPNMDYNSLQWKKMLINL
jgi:hypothetical protein